jgi:hypothetical protein
MALFPRGKTQLCRSLRSSISLSTDGQEKCTYSLAAVMLPINSIWPFGFMKPKKYISHMHLNVELLMNE